MNAVVVSGRADVDRLRAAIARDRRLIEPREGDWTESDAGAPFDWEASAPLTGAKRWFFPPRELLLQWGPDRVPQETTPGPPPFALVGLRACDLAAIAYQDGFFAGDPWYGARRRAALLVGIDCLTACDGGFCLEVDTGPFARAPYDLNLTPLPDGRVVVAWGTPAGRAVLTGAALAVTAVDTDMVLLLADLCTAAAASFPERPFVGRALARMDAAPGAAAIGDDEWQALGPACLACTGCTSVCPTCSCFTVVDEPRGGGGERARLWDSCLLEGFQREASGHHPAPRPGDRVRRFWSHKLSREFALDGRIGCVGCGRCDVTCPGSIGALRVLAALGSVR